ncbi:MAG: CvpA family protein [Firmicutes bacterium]|nr:CvpA family protein [Bacillota bacterium]
MNPDIVVLCIVILAALLGYIIGFGKTLKWFTGGIVGIIISIAACVMLGGAVQSLEFVKEFINSVNASASDFWNPLGYFAGYVAYYLIMFLVVQILRMIIIRIVKKVFESENTVMKTVNRILGTVFMAGFVIALILVFFAIVEAVSGTAFGENMLERIKGSVMEKIFNNNPITFLVAKIASGE